jgi:dCTP deaminase
MIVNGTRLLAAAPLAPMRGSKIKRDGVSYGLSEAGYDIRIAQAVTLHPFKRFTLASTYEYFAMPPSLVGVVHDKSTWARRGLSVFNTVIEPAWRGWLTLELVYSGWGVLHIPEGAGIAQVLFHQIIEPAAYSGKYQDQPNRPVGAIKSENDK